MILRYILFGFPIFRFWAYLMKIIPQMRRGAKFDSYVFIAICMNQQTKIIK